MPRLSHEDVNALLRAQRAEPRLNVAITSSDTARVSIDDLAENQAAITFVNRGRAYLVTVKQGARVIAARHSDKIENAIDYARSSLDLLRQARDAREHRTKR